MEAAARAALVARASYGRLVALLAARNGDIAAAEEALSAAFLAALEKWPQTGIPKNPEGWLMAAAKNQATDAHRKHSKHTLLTHDEMTEFMDADSSHETAEEDVPDERLRLLFVCAHPAIDASIHTPLMLQVVLGFEATDIAKTLLISPTALAQRLVRAKRKIKEARIEFAVPEKKEMASRLSSVLEAIYGAYSLDWLHAPDERDMSEEAIFLLRLLARLLPEEPEVCGAAALISFAHARRAARIEDGMLVPLHEQDISRWDDQLISEADAHLAQAARFKSLGRFQLEAAIQQAHVNGVLRGQLDWTSVLHLSEGMCRLWPTAGAHVNRIAAMAHVAGPAVALEVLEKWRAVNDAFQPAEATRAHLLMQLNRHEDAARAYQSAIDLTVEPACRRWLERQRKLALTTAHN